MFPLAMPTTCEPLYFQQHLFQGGTFVTADEPVFTQHHPMKAVVYTKLHFGTVSLVGLDKYMQPVPS